MCRLMAYVGQPQLLADVVLWPDRSIIKQSYDARERKIDPTLPFHLGHGNLNGDGFGIGWFSTDERRERDPSPCVFTSITPAWNNENLSRLACKIVSPLVFAHVRAAYPGMPVSEQNCHPFQFSRYMWMHNGVVAGFAQIRRSLLETLSDCAYNAVQSFHSDSAVSFAIFLNHLPDIRTQQPPDVLIKAMQDTIATISSVQRRHGITDTSLLNYVVSDGATLIATRFVSPESDGPASLYYAEGASFSRTPAQQQQQPAPGVPPAAAAAGGGSGGCAGAAGAQRGAVAAAAPPCPAGSTSGSSITQESSYELGFSAQGPAVVFVASEPITASASDWVAVPKNTALVVTREKGGFLNTLRCPLQGFPQPAPSPLPSLPSPGLAAPPGAAALPPLPRRSSGGGTGAQGPLGYPDPQRDVCLCLEALSRGITAKSRAFLAHRPTGLGFSTGSSIFQPAPDTLAQELPSMTSMAMPSNGFSRSSAGGAAGQAGPGDAPTTAVQAPAGPGAASRAGSQGLDALPPSDADTHHYMRLVGHAAPVIVTAICPHTSRLYTASVDCSVRVWSLRDNSCLHTLVGQRKPVTAMRLRAHGRLLLAASGRKIRVWDAVGFRCLQLIKISDSCGTIRCMEVLGVHHHNGRHHGSGHHRHLLARAQADGAGAGETNAGGGGGEPAVGVLANGAAARTGEASGRSSISGDVLLSPRRSRYSSADGGSSSLSLAEVLSLQEVVLDTAATGLDAGDRNGGAAAAGQEGGPQGNGDLSLLYVGCQDATVKVFTLDEHQLLDAAAAAAAAEAAERATAPPPPPPPPASPAPAAPPRQPSASTPPRSPFVPARPGDSLATRTSTTGMAGPPALLPPRIISTPEEPDAGISDLAPLMVTAAGGGAHVGPVNCLALCGRYLCSGGGDATVRVWDAATLKLVGVLRGHRGSVLCLLGLGSSLLLSGARDNTIRVWDLEMDMMCRRTLTGHKDDVTGLAAITLHKRFPAAAAAAAANGAAAGGGAGGGGGGGGGWSVGSFTPPSGFLTPGGRSVGLASTVVASSSADGTVRLWSTSWNCLCILSLPVSAGPSVPAALCACVSPDVAIAGYTDGELRLWHIEDVHGAVLQRCYSEVAAAAEALQAACGCVVHGSAAVQGALQHVRQHGAAGAAAAAAALADPACRTASGVQATLALLSSQSTGAGGAANRAQPEPAAPPAPAPGPELPAAAQPSQPAGTGAPGGGSAMLQSPSLAHLVGGGRRPDSRASNASAASGGRSACESDGGAAGVDLAPPPAQAQGQQDPLLLQPQQQQQHAARDAAPAANGGSADPAAGGCGADGGCCPALGPGQGSAALFPASGSSVFSLGTPALPPAGPSASSAAAVPIHIHGRRSPLSAASAVNLAALAAGAAGAAAAGGQGAAPCSRVPLPLPLGGGHFCSTSDQQLEAALRDFVRIKTVSSSPKLRDDCHKGAKFLAKMLEGLGADVKVVQVYEDKNPVVIGRLGRNPELPTVTFYGHYDVQPAAEPDWATNPFELNSVNEYLYGRGVSDNKGPVLAFIFAVRELMNACGDWPAGGCGGGRLGRLPVNVAFVFEGEEENGSRGFAQAVTQNLSWFEGTQLIVISNTLWVGENVPCLTYGMRGMLSLTVQITGPERDLHSGNDGGVFAEPMVDLLRVMATLIGPGCRVQVPGFYDDVEPSLIELAWTSLEDSEEFSLEGYKAALGVPALTAPPNKRDLLITRWCRPSLSVVDMRPCAAAAGLQAEPAATCYRFGPTRFSVIPKAAQGKVSVRFVPNQDADQLVACLRQHVQHSFASLGSSNHIDLHVEARGNWWEVRHGSPWLAMAEAAIHKEWGVHPLYVREGGTMPVASYLERLLCAPAIMIPMGQSSDNCHLANERIRRTNLFKGKNVIRRLLEEVAAMGTQPDGAAAAGAAGGGGADGPVVDKGAGDAAAGNGVAEGDWGAPTACAGLEE